MQRLVAAIAVLVGLSCGAPAQQAYPNRIIHLMQGFPPGGNVDIIARILGHEMEKSLGQSIVIEAKPGLAGALAAETVARSDADGYTLLMLPSAHPAYAALSKNVKFKVVDDFTWISVASFYPFMIAVKADSRFQSLKQIIDLQIQHDDQGRRVLLIRFVRPPRVLRCHTYKAKPIIPSFTASKDQPGQEVMSPCCIFQALSIRMGCFRR